MSSHQSLKISRRTLIKGTASALVLAPSLGILPLASAKDPIKTAGIYTVPVEQQWVSRIHKAALAAQSRGDIAYTFTENTCLLYTSPSPRDRQKSRMPSSA